MSNLIDREEAILAIPDSFIWDSVFKACNNQLGYEEAVNKIVDDVTYCINRVPIVNEWTPISDPPKENGRYLVACYELRFRQNTSIEYFDAEYDIEHGFGLWVRDTDPACGKWIKVRDVIAWKPIEPYTGDKE